MSFLRRRFADPPPPKNQNGKVLLHIGCGPINSPGFINVDAQPFAHVHVVTDDLAHLSDFANDSADLIYMCHVLEHMKRPRLRDVLGEMKRVLKPGGVLRLSVPDFDRLIDVYNQAGGEIDAIHNQLMGGQDSDYNIHYSAFNRKALSALLQEVGFQSVRPWDPSDCQHHDFKDKAGKVMQVGGRRIAISLNLEAVKSSLS